LLTENLVESILAALPRLTIGLAGDLFLDRYLEIDPDLHELSVETGLEAYQVTHIRNSPGALGTVINNLAALGVGRLVPVTVVGDDGQAYDLLKQLARLPVDPRHILKDPRRMTPTYTKPMQCGEDGTWRELNRLDLRNRTPLASETEATLLAGLAETFHATDGLIVLDQVNEEEWGVITPRVRERLAELDNEAARRKLIVVDSRTRIGEFRSGTLKANRSECLAAAGLAKTDSPGAIAAAAAALGQRTGRPVFCTLGPDGILIAESGRPPVAVPGYPVSGPVDTVGAGDSATAGIVTALLAGAGALEAAAFGNLVASITVQQLGTTGIATPEQIRARFSAVSD
jgi:rfaE bifunctional protein kinase chain/domain